MKIILHSVAIVALLSTTGCLIREDGGHGHARYEHHEDVVVGVPVVEVRPPVVIVR